MLPIIIIGVLFFIFGFITWLNGALIPFLQIVSDLNEFQALLIAFSFYIAYTVMALPMSWILEKTGYKLGIVYGLSLVGMGSFLFIPAAKTQIFAVFLFAQFTMGAGLTLLQTAANPYIVKLGPSESAAARIAVMGILNKLAGVLAPLAFTALVLAEFAGVNAASIAALPALERKIQITNMANNLIMPYFAMGLSLCCLALIMWRIQMPTTDDNAGADTNDKTTVWRHPQLIWGAISLFFYVGVEVIAGDTIGLYGSSLGLDNVTALTSYTMAAMVLGYFIGLAVIPRFVQQHTVLVLSAIVGVLLSVGIVLSSDTSTTVADVLWGWSNIPVLPNSVTLIALLGIANAMVWPAIWPLALADLGKHTAKGSALLIMGIAGGAILPLVYGGLAELTNPKQAYLFLLSGYLLIGWYGLKGYKLRIKAS
ncbi:sugar MFS transporter [Agaribacter marinus]|uniref:Glucose/galactose MFS transporter n=1 Tax=Agaribacter marinus TaxID=1431249 RepID=A0AA37WHW5_9ALTE|nr:sugar MFS transporter [Agaribacter marinus]GLR70398.1 glucose/galactose MFS transporter [Agaribacter marinus]